MRKFLIPQVLVLICFQFGSWRVCGVDDVDDPGIQIPHPGPSPKERGASRINYSLIRHISRRILFLPLILNNVNILAIAFHIVFLACVFFYLVGIFELFNMLLVFVDLVLVIPLVGFEFVDLPVEQSMVEPGVIVEEQHPGRKEKQYKYVTVAEEPQPRIPVNRLFKRVFHVVGVLARIAVEILFCRTNILY